MPSATFSWNLCADIHIAASFVSFLLQLKCHLLREAFPDYSISCCLFLSHALQSIYYSDIFLIYLFTFSTRMEDRDIMFTSMVPAPGTVPGTEQVLGKHLMALKEWSVALRTLALGSLLISWAIRTSVSSFVKWRK